MTHIDSAFAHSKTATRTFTAQEANALLSALGTARVLTPAFEDKVTLTALIASISEGWF